MKNSIRKNKEKKNVKPIKTEIMTKEITNENLGNNSNQTQQENLSERSIEILKMTSEKKEEIQLLRKDGLIPKGLSNSLVHKCNDILNQNDDESILDTGRKHGGHLCINYNELYRNPEKMEELRILFFGTEEEKQSILNKIKN